AHAEVRQAVGPEAGSTQLRRAVDWIDAENRVPVNGCRDRAKEVPAHRLRPFRHAALDPYLVGGLAPAGVHADAVAGGHDLVEVLEQRLPAEPLEHSLPNLVGGFDVQGDTSDSAECAQPHDHAVEVGVASGCGDD